MNIYGANKRWASILMQKITYFDVDGALGSSLYRFGELDGDAVAFDGELASSLVAVVSCPSFVDSELLFSVASMVHTKILFDQNVRRLLSQSKNFEMFQNEYSIMIILCL